MSLTTSDKLIIALGIGAQLESINQEDRQRTLEEELETARKELETARRKTKAPGLDLSYPFGISSAGRNHGFLYEPSLGNKLKKTKKKLKALKAENKLLTAEIAKLRAALASGDS